MTARPDISVVVPVYNGAATLADLYQRTSTIMASLNLQFEMLLIDDGSKDRSWHEIVSLKENAGNKIRGFQLARNSGQQAATLCGLQHASGSWIITLDDDLQTPPEEIPKLLDAAKCRKADVVFGVYPSLKHGFLHSTGTRVFRYVLQKIAPAFPNGSSFRLINADLLRSVTWHTGPWVVVDPVLSWHTSNISTVSIRHEKTRQRSRYSFFKLLNMAITLLIVYSVWPLRFMIWFGFFSALVSFGIGSYFIYQKLTVGAALGFSALIVTVTFATGVILLCLGVLGEYISRIYTMGTGHPAFTIKTIV